MPAAGSVGSGQQITQIRKRAIHRRSSLLNVVGPQPQHTVGLWDFPRGTSRSLFQIYSNEEEDASAVRHRRFVYCARAHVSCTIDSNSSKRSPKSGSATEQSKHPDAFAPYASSSSFVRVGQEAIAVLAPLWTSSLLALSTNSPASHLAIACNDSEGGIVNCGPSGENSNSPPTVVDQVVTFMIPARLLVLLASPWSTPGPEGFTMHPGTSTPDLPGLLKAGLDSALVMPSGPYRPVPNPDAKLIKKFEKNMASLTASARPVRTIQTAVVHASLYGTLRIRGRYSNATAATMAIGGLNRVSAWNSRMSCERTHNACASTRGRDAAYQSGLPRATASRTMALKTQSTTRAGQSPMMAPKVCAATQT